MKREIYYRAKDIINSKIIEGWEDYGVIPKDTLCEVKEYGLFECLTIFFNNKAVCDIDSPMAIKYFDKISKN